MSKAPREDGMSEWRKLQASCQFCGGAMEAQPNHVAGRMELKGCEPMSYRHVETRKSECFTRHEGRPYTGWGQYEDWQKAATPEETNDE